MATNLFSPISTLSFTTEKRDLGLLSKSSILPGSLPFSSSSLSHHGNLTFSRRFFESPCAQNASSDRIPKQFRQENLKDGLMDNFKNVPEYLYRLSPSQIDMLMTEDNPVCRQSEKVTKQSISSASSYLDNSGILSCSAPRVLITRARGGGYGRRRRPPPNIASDLLNSRIIYLGLPMYPAVTELLAAEFLWLDYDDPSKPIYLMINSPGTQELGGGIVGLDTGAYALADYMANCQPDVHTLNLSMAFGQAAMLLSLGKKGCRYLMPSSLTTLHLPKVDRSSGVVTDMWIKAKELESNTDYYTKLLAEGIGKSQEELAKDIRLPKVFESLEAIEYGVADKIFKPTRNTASKRS